MIVYSYARPPKEGVAIAPYTITRPFLDPFLETAGHRLSFPLHWQNCIVDTRYDLKISGTRVFRMAEHVAVRVSSVKHEVMDLRCQVGSAQ